MRPREFGALLPVLRAISVRGAHADFERPVVDGYSREEVDVAVDELRRCGYVVTAILPGSLRDNPPDRPTSLTVKGRQLLEDLER